jgi:hypothetical protein
VTYSRLNGENLLAIKLGQTAPRRAVLVVAHHDTVRDAPGADDNGSGLAALKELGRVLGPHQFDRTIILASPDHEEIGLIGSRELARELAARFELEDVIVYDAIGYRSREPATQAVPGAMGILFPEQRARIARHHDAGDFVAVLHRGASRQLAHEMGEALAETGELGSETPVLLRNPIDRPLVGPLLGWLPSLRNFGRSDSDSFERLRRRLATHLPKVRQPNVILVTDTANARNPNYHQPTDTAGTLDYAFLAQTVQATAITVARRAGLRSLNSTVH